MREMLSGAMAGANTIVDYGYMITVSAVFIIVTIYLFISTNKRYTQMFNQIIESNARKNTDISDNLSTLVKQISKVLEIVQENQDGINQKALRYQTYTGAMKIIKSYLKKFQLELIIGANKIVEKNNIDDVENVRRRVNTLVCGINKKRSIEMTEFMFADQKLSDVVHIDNDALSIILIRYITDKHRTFDRLIIELDQFFYDVLNVVDERFVNENGR
jgi:hypothetical protein